MNLVQSILEHHGVKGQKWGVRRRTPSEDAARAKAFRKKHVSELSDSELKHLVNRMNMEQNHRRLNQSTVSKGLAATGTILAAGATLNTAIAFSKSPAGLHLRNALEAAATKAIRIPVSSIGTTG